MLEVNEEAQANGLIREYLEYAEYRDSLMTFDKECEQRGRKVTKDERYHGQDGEKIVAIQRQFMQKFYQGDREEFYNLWETHFPQAIRQNDPLYQKLDFYLNIYFAIFPIHSGVDGVAASRHSLEMTMEAFKQFLETRGAELCKTPQFLSYYALPYVPEPTHHPSFKDIFTNAWIRELEERLDQFLTTSLKTAQRPRILKFLYDAPNSTLPGSESMQLRSAHAQLRDAEDRISLLVTRHRTLQGDYHSLVSVASELVQTLTAVLNGEQITPIYLANICQRLVSFRRGAAANPMHPSTGGVMASARASPSYTHHPPPPTHRVTPVPGLPPAYPIANPPLPSHISAVPTQRPIIPIPRLLPGVEQYLDYEAIRSDLSGPEGFPGDVRKKVILLHALRWHLRKSNINQKRQVIAYFAQQDVLGIKSTTTESSQKLLSVLLHSNHQAVKEHTARLLNEMASTVGGREYLLDTGAIGFVVPVLVEAMKSESKDTVYKQNLLGCVQKLSLRRAAQSALNNLNLISYIHDTLTDMDSLSDYTVEYSVALLMNLCLRKSGKQQIMTNSNKTLKLLVELIEHENTQIKTYVNGTLYSLLGEKEFRNQAKAMGLQEMLGYLKDEADEALVKQIDYVLEQLNASDEAAEGEDGENNDDTVSEDGEEEDLGEGEEEDEFSDSPTDDEDLEDPQPGEIIGDEFLKSNYYTPKHTSYPKPLVQAMQPRPNSAARLLSKRASTPLSRPMTPSRHVAPGSTNSSESDLKKSVRELKGTVSRLGELNEDKPTASGELGLTKAVIKPPPPSEKVLKNIKKMKSDEGEMRESIDEKELEEYYLGFATRPKVPRTPIVAFSRR